MVSRRPSFSLRPLSFTTPDRYARNHPCIASWTTCDEKVWKTIVTSPKHLAPRPALLDPQRRAIVRSTAGRDAHVYHVGTAAPCGISKMTEPFVSELGATCLPNYETLNQIHAQRLAHSRACR